MINYIDKNLALLWALRYFPSLLISFFWT